MRSLSDRRDPADRVRQPSAGPNACAFPENLVGQTFLMPAPGSGIRECADVYLRSLGLVPKQFRVAMTIGDPFSPGEMVQSGLGIAFVSKHAAAYALRDGSVVRLPLSQKRLSRKLYMMVHPSSSLLARTFKKICPGFPVFQAGMSFFAVNVPGIWAFPPDLTTCDSET